MKLTSIGNQSWLLSSGRSHLLVDPVLDSGFGASPITEFRIEPQRQVDTGAMPQPSAIVLTSEHLQHFQPRSFLYLANNRATIPVHVSDLFPACAVEALEGLNFSVYRHRSGKTFSVDGIDVSLFGNSAQNLPWDRRVAALYSRDNHHAVLIQSDCRPSNRLRAHVEAEAIPLGAIVATNNAVALHPNSGAGLTNLLPVSGGGTGSYLGARLLVDSLLTNFTGFPLTRHMILCGGSFRDTGGLIPPFHWKHEDLADAANALSLGTRVHALLPGQCLDLSPDGSVHEVTWIHRRAANEIKGSAKSTNYLSMGSYLPSESYVPDLDEVAAELKRLAKAVVLSGFGSQLLRTNSYLGRELSGERFVIQLINADGDPLDLVFDLAQVGFGRTSYSGNEALRRYPFGIRAMQREFCALLTGGILVWEFSMISARQWRAGPRFVSPMSCFYEFFDEAIRQNLAQKYYERDLALYRSRNAVSAR